MDIYHSADRCCRPSCSGRGGRYASRCVARGARVPSGLPSQRQAMEVYRNKTGAPYHVAHWLQSNVS